MHTTDWENIACVVLMRCACDIRILLMNLTTPTWSVEVKLLFARLFCRYPLVFPNDAHNLRADIHVGHGDG